MPVYPSSVRRRSLLGYLPTFLCLALLVLAMQTGLVQAQERDTHWQVAETELATMNYQPLVEKQYPSGQDSTAPTQALNQNSMPSAAGNVVETIEIAAAYVAFFERAPDYDGLEYWANQAGSGVVDFDLMRRITSGFTLHPSYTAIYGSLSDSAFVDTIYINIGGAPADADGRAYWLARLSDGMTRPDLIARFILDLLSLTEATADQLVADGIITRQERDDALLRKNRLTNKSFVALAFANVLGETTNLSSTTDPMDPASLVLDPAYRASRKIISEVTHDMATRNAVLAYLDTYPSIDDINGGTSPTEPESLKMVATANGASASVVLGGKGDEGSSRYFKVTVPEGVTNLVIETSGEAGDPDLYVERGAKPTINLSADTSYCASTNAGTVEQCAYAAPQAGDYYILIYGYSAYMNLTLTASWVNGDLTVTPINLTVDVFGEGNIVDKLQGIDCSDRKCVYEYMEEKQVELQAIPDDNWKFAYWNGCDVVDGDRCLVDLIEDRVVYPTFESNTSLALQPNVMRLDAATVSKIQSQSGNMLVFDATASQAAETKLGDIIVSTEGEGFARRVLSITSLGSSIFVNTEQVALEDIIQEGTLVFSEALTPQNVVEINAEPGVRMMRSNAESSDTGKIKFEIDQVVYDKDGDLKSIDDQVHVKGTIEAKLKPDLAVHISLFEGLREFRSIIHKEEEYKVDVFVGGALEEFNKEHFFSLASIRFSPIIVGPVVIVPVVKGFVSAEGEIKIGLVTSGSLEWKNSAGIHYRKETGWAGIVSSNFSPDFTLPQLTGEARLDVSFGTYSQLQLYGVAGPFFRVGPYALFEAKSSVGLEEQCGKWDFYFGGRIKAGLEVSKILSWRLMNYEASLFDRRWKISGDNFGNCNDTESPEPPGEPVIESESVTGLVFRFDAAKDDIGVEKYEIYRAPSEFVANTNNTVFFDDGLQHSTRYCYYVIAVDGENNRSNPSTTGCGETKAQDDWVPPTKPNNLTVDVTSSRSVELNWDLSKDDVGVAGYLISRNNNFVDHTEFLNHFVVGLEPNSSYCFNVSAFDEAGNLSSPSETVCAVTRLAETAAWRMRIKCSGRDSYLLESHLDIEEDVENRVSLDLDGYDYSGSKLFLSLTGSYDQEKNVLDGRIDYTFDASSCLRTDIFSVDLSLPDSGNVPMHQVAECGCDTEIRFDRISEQSMTADFEKQPVTVDDGFGYCGSKLFGASDIDTYCDRTWE